VMAYNALLSRLFFVSFFVCVSTCLLLCFTSVHYWFAWNSEKLAIRKLSICKLFQHTTIILQFWSWDILTRKRHQFHGYWVVPWIGSSGNSKMLLMQFDFLYHCQLQTWGYNGFTAMKMFCVSSGRV
jgi:hypothetical protein